jgi:hypothetical protein
MHSVYLKQSELAFSMGDVDNERYYREQVYGSLVKLQADSRGTGQ